MVQFESIQKQTDIDTVLPLDVSIEQESESDLLIQLRILDSECTKDLEAIINTNHFQWIISLMRFQEKKKDGYSLNLLEKIGDTVLQLLDQGNSDVDGVSLINQKQMDAFKRFLFMGILFVSSTAFNAKKDGAISLEEKEDRKKKRQDLQKQNENRKQLVDLQIHLMVSIKDSLIILQTKERLESTEERFSKYIQDWSMLNLLKSKEFMESDQGKNSLLRILDKLVSAQGGQQTLMKNVINVVYDREEQVKSMSELVQCAFKCDIAQLVGWARGLMQQLVQVMLQRTNLSSESQAVKNVKRFMELTSESIPKLFNNNIPVFLQLYDSDSYLMRNSISDILCNIIKHVLTQPPSQIDSQQQEHLQKNKAQYINILMSRLQDRHTYGRTFTLSTLGILTEANLIPSHILLLLFKSVIKRVNDVSAAVRKKSIQLINALFQVFYDLLVTSQNRKVFYSQQELKHEMSLLQTEIDISKENMKEQETLLKSMGEDQEDEFDALKEKHDNLKNKIIMNNQLLYKLQEYSEFIGLMKGIVPVLIRLLQSKSSSDVIQSIRLLVKMKQKNIEESEQGIQKILGLIWSKDDSEQKQSVRDEVTYGYYQLYFQHAHPQVVAQSLIDCFISNMPDTGTLEEVIQQIFKKNHLQAGDHHKIEISSQVTKHLWEIFRESYDTNKHLQMLASVQLIRLLAEQDKTVVGQKIQLVQQVIRKEMERSEVDWLLIKQVSLIVKSQGQQEDQAKDILGKSVVYLLLKHMQCQDDNWYLAGESILDMIFGTQSQPEIIGQYLIQRGSQLLIGMEGEVEFTDMFGRLAFLIGHLSLKVLLLIDDLESSIRRMKNEKDKEEVEVEKNQLNQMSGGLEAEVDARLDKLQNILDKDIIQGPLIGQFSHSIGQVCKDLLNKKRGSGKGILEKVCVLSLAKMMCVSKTFCSQYLEVFVQLLGCDWIQPSLTINLLISFGDILKRFPNIVEKHTGRLYLTLRSPDINVKKTALMVITHLVLNDMLKLKQEVADLAPLFCDPDPQILNLIKLFFYELNKKNNKAMQNLLPEAIGRLSNEIDFNESQFQIFAQNFMQYLEQDKFSETLVTKLCARIKNSSSEKEAINSSYCLTLLSINDNAIRRLLSCFNDYRDKLEIQQVLTNFKSILQKKKSTKQESKILYEEFQEKINNYLTVECKKEDYVKKNKSRKKKEPQKKRKQNDFIDSSDNNSISSSQYKSNYYDQLINQNYYQGIQSKEKIIGDPSQRVLRKKKDQIIMDIEEEQEKGNEISEESY